MIISPWHVSVLIPARNEEDLLPRCLRSIMDARSELPPRITSDVIVVSDSSTDRTASIAARLLGKTGQVISIDAGIVGQARACAASAALSRYRGPLRYCWLANTDADCDVPRNWLLHQLELADHGVEAVTGIVDVDTFGEHQAGVSELFRMSYHLFPDGSHPHVHGANIGLRADAYLRAGGWANLATAEDHDLWGRLRVSGCRQTSTTALTVVTSGRRVGRAPLGFAGALAAHNEALA